MNRAGNGKYNLLLIANQKYFEMAKICVHSIFKNTDTERINHFYIADIGLHEDAATYFKSFSPKICILDTNVVIGTSKDRHTKEWVDAVCQKTRLLKDIVSGEDNLPLVTMDVDHVVLKDFYQIIDCSKALQFCRREKPAYRPDMNMSYIGSFLTVNSKLALPFIERWIERMRERIEAKSIPAYETPALCEVIEEFKDEIPIGDLRENEISCNNNYVEGVTRIIHMKSEEVYESEDLISGRVEAVTNYDHRKIMGYLNYYSTGIDEYLDYKKTRNARVVIYTAISDHADDLIQHLHLSKDYDYVCFTDMEVESSGVWEIRPLEDRGLDSNRSAKFYKVFPDQFFDDYEYSIWIDGNIDILNDDLERRVQALIEKDMFLACNIHGQTDCVYEEIGRCLITKKDEPEAILKQADFLKQKSFPQNYGFFEMNMIYRKHSHPAVLRLMQDWWKMILAYSKRDQLSFPYVLKKNNMQCNALFPNNAREIEGFAFKDHNQQVISLLFYDTGNGYNYKEMSYDKLIISADKKYRAEFIIDSPSILKKVKLEPVKFEIFKFRVEKVIIEHEEGIKTIGLHEVNRLLRSNGTRLKSGFLHFASLLPEIELEIELKVKKISFIGELHLDDTNIRLLEMLSIKTKTVEGLFGKPLASLLGKAFPRGTKRRKFVVSGFVLILRFFSTLRLAIALPVGYIRRLNQ